MNIASTPADPNRLYTYVDMAGIYRSDDAGRTWRTINGGIPYHNNSGYEIRGVNVDPRNADKLLVAVGHQEYAPQKYGLLASDDGGQSYTLVLSATFAGNVAHRDAGYVIARSPANPDTVLAGSFGDGVWRSDDAGRTWRKLGLENLQITDIRFDLHNDNRVWVCSQPYTGRLGGEQKSLAGGFYRSDNAGQDWTLLSSEESPTEIAQDPDQSDVLLGIFARREVRRSTDAGSTWTGYSEGLVISPTPPKYSDHKVVYGTLAVAPGYFILGNGDGDLWRRSASDAAWRPIVRKHIDAGDWWGNVGHRPGYVHFGKARGFLWVNPTDPKHWLATDWFGIWATYDAGETWKASFEGYEPTYIFHLNTNRNAPGIVHVAMSDNGYFRSTDGGQTFKQAGTGISAQIRDVETSPGNPKRVYAVGAALQTPGTWVVNQLYVSDDEANSWRAETMDGLPDMKVARCASITADPANADLVYLAVSGEVGPGAGGPYRSVDGGRTWTWMGEGLPEGQKLFRDDFWGSGREIVAADDGSLLCFSRITKGAWRYDPQDRKWSAVMTVNTLPNAIAVAPAGGKSALFSVGAEGLFFSNELGKAGTWKKVLDGRVGRVTFHPSDPSIAVASVTVKDEGLIFVTRDGGLTWSPLESQPPMRTGFSFAFSGSHLLVGTAGGGIFERVTPIGNK